jgi:glycyl-tRNA synthetase beta chain
MKNNKNFLLEIGCEEIPARFMPSLLADLQAKSKELLTKERLAYSSINTYGTYRRLTLYISNLAEKQQDLCQESKGPPAKIAIDENGTYLPPAIGFAKRLSIEPTELKVKEENGQKYIFGTKNEKGQSSKEILPKLLETLVFSLTLPIAMRWGCEQKTFIRPIHWLVSLYGKEIIPFEMFNIKSSNHSHGHRFLTKNTSQKLSAHGKKLIINSAQDYFTEMENSFVIIDQNKRHKAILQFVNKNTEEYSKNLVEEVVHLTEYPKPLLGKFSDKYLELPEEVLTQCMQKHQKYFPVFHQKKLQAQFILIAENVTAKSKQNIISGNENVLIARLEDVRYFWEEDCKINLEKNIEKLKDVVFQKNLGSIYDKVERLKKISTHLVNIFGLQDQAKNILRTCELCKADLVTHMVFELPALQGTMGRLYALKHSEETIVADGIKEHYLPQSQTDMLPQTITGTITSLADKFDTIVSCFANNLIPTGSHDPWGIRRAIYGILKITYENSYNLNFEHCIDKAYEYLDMKHQPNKDKLLAFFSQRSNSFLTEQNIPYDIANAIAPLSMCSLTKSVSVGIALSKIKETTPVEFKTLVETAVRVKRLAKNAKQNIKVNSALFKESIENEALNELTSISKKAEQENHSKPTTLLALTQPMINYFDKVLVMDKDDKTKQNRLAFLSNADNLYTNFANFEEISI